jgi:hypothetical protein
MAERHVGSGQTYSTIAAAYAAASGGDEIVIHPGTYVETISIVASDKNNLTFRSSTGDPSDVLWQGTGTLGAAYPWKVYLVGTTGTPKDLYVQDITLRSGSNGGGAANMDGKTSSYYTRIWIENCWLQVPYNKEIFIISNYARVEFDRCILEGYKSAGAVASWSISATERATFRNCLVYSPEKLYENVNVKHYHSTIVHGRATSLIYNTGAWGYYYGCIFYNWGRFASGAQDLWSGSGTPNFSECVFYRPDGCDQSDPDLLEEDPSLVGGTTVRGTTGDSQIPTDCQLQVGSPAIDHVATDFGLSDDFFGNARPLGDDFDAGFHERPAPLPRPVGPYLNNHAIRRGDLVT